MARTPAEMPHCRIAPVDRQPEPTDPNATNGTFLDDKRIAATTPMPPARRITGPRPPVPAGAPG